MKYTIKLLQFFILALIVFSCEKDDEIKVDYSSVYPIAGSWIVSEYWEGEFGYGPYELMIYNTANSADSLWIDNLYDSSIKIKAVKTGSNTFSVDSSSFEDLGIYLSISNGQVINTDSIYMDVEIYLLEDGSLIDSYAEAGKRKTGFEGH